MAIKSQQLRQSFLVSGAGIAVLLVLFVAWITSNRVGNVLEQQADVRGRDVATRVAAMVTQYLKERRREVGSLASEPGLLGALRHAGPAPAPRCAGRAGPPRRAGSPGCRSPTWSARSAGPASWAAPTRYCATTCAPTR